MPPVTKQMQRESGRSRGIDRAFDILDHLHETKKPLRPNEIAIAIGAPKSTTYDIVGVLLNRGILEPADGDGEPPAAQRAPHESAP